MGSKEEWQAYQEALKRNDPEAAAAAFQRYLAARKQEGLKSSSPTLVNLSTKDKTYSNAIPLDNVPSELATNPEFFELMKRVSSKEG
jgi:hypothetical protein